MSERRQLNLRLDSQRLAHLDRMAAKAGVQPGSLAKSMLESLIDDDAKAHTLELAHNKTASEQGGSSV